MKKAVFAFLMILISLPALSAEKVGKVGWWGIYYDDANDGDCYAAATYDGGDRFFIGIKGKQKSWYFQFENSNWSSIVPGDTYPIKYRFGRTTWTGDTKGYTNGLYAGSLKESFIRDIARRGSLAIYYSGNRLGKYSLRGTRKAIAAVEQCFKTRIQKYDPFSGGSGSDPFAGGNGGSGSDPFAR